jgi:hypothetical protein
MAELLFDGRWLCRSRDARYLKLPRQQQVDVDFVVTGGKCLERGFHISERFDAIELAGARPTKLTRARISPALLTLSAQVNEQYRLLQIQLVLQISNIQQLDFSTARFRNFMTKQFRGPLNLLTKFGGPRTLTGLH